MDRKVVAAVILESHDCLTPLAHAESRTRRHAIVANKICGLQTLVNLMSKWLDIDLVVVDGVASRSVGVSVERRLVRRERQRVLEDLLVLRTKPFVVASQSL